MTYGIIFWGNSTHSIHVFQLLKRVIRIITNSTPRDSCRQLFKQLGILPLTLQYIFSLLLFVANDRALFQMISEIHNTNTRYGFNFHRPHVHLTPYKNGAYYTGIKVFNCLPTHMKIYLIMLISLNWLWGIFFNIHFIL